MWREENDKLIRDFEFSNFVQAFDFLKEVAELAEEHKHHPEIFNVYNKVTLGLSTHDAGDIVTDKDHRLAEAIDRL